jgi:DNA-binding NarL/FixJ family response regulator
MTAIRILIADDHRLFREGVKALLSTTEEISILGEAEDGAAAVDACRLLQPDIILMDINIPGLNGIQATHQVLASTRR